MTTRLDIDELLGEEIRCQCGLLYLPVCSSAHYKTSHHIRWEKLRDPPFLESPSFQRLPVDMSLQSLQIIDTTARHQQNMRTTKSAKGSQQSQNPDISTLSLELDKFWN